MKSPLTVKSSPHIAHPDSTMGIMLDVIIALAPACIYSIVLFGIKALLLYLTCIASTVASEFVWNKILKKPLTVNDLSAVVTGLLLAMCLPSSTPLWIGAIGGVVAIIVVKQMFGGLGYNFVNPAATARIVLMVSFPKYITTFTEPITDAVTSATPLTEISANTVTYSVKNLFFGMTPGSLGETSAFLLIVGGIYLILRGVINPVTPVCFIGTVALASFIAGENLSVALLGGGLMLGAIFMATDYTTSPTTPLGKAIFGVGCGLITFVIRKFASLPEGVSYAIILMNILVPYINKISLKKPFGYVKPKKEGEKA